MPVWMIALLICIVYFLNEVRRAPIIEDNGSNDSEEAPSERSEARRSNLPRHISDQ